MNTTIVLMSSADAWRRHEQWLRRPHQWLFWRVPSRAFQIPLPSLWGLEPVRRVAASVEMTDRLCPPVPASAFHAYAPSDWYRRWMTASVDIENRAAENRIKRFPEILARHSPVALLNAPTRAAAAAEPDARVRKLGALRKEVKSLCAMIESSGKWRSYSVEWASCRVLIDAFDRAVAQEQSAIFFPQWPVESEADVVHSYELAARGFHRMRSVVVVDGGNAAEVLFLNGSRCRIRAKEALANIGGESIASATIGRRKGTVVLYNEQGVKTELTPRNILMLRA